MYPLWCSTFLSRFQHYEALALKLLKAWLDEAPSGGTSARLCGLQLQCSAARCHSTAVQSEGMAIAVHASTGPYWALQTAACSSPAIGCVRMCSSLPDSWRFRAFATAATGLLRPTLLRFYAQSRWGPALCCDGNSTLIPAAQMQMALQPPAA